MAHLQNIPSSYLSPTTCSRQSISGCRQTSTSTDLPASILDPQSYHYSPQSERQAENARPSLPPLLRMLPWILYQPAPSPWDLLAHLKPFLLPAHLAPSSLAFVWFLLKQAPTDPKPFTLLRQIGMCYRLVQNSEQDPRPIKAPLPLQQVAAHNQTCFLGSMAVRTTSSVYLFTVHQSLAYYL